ncbi:MAG: hypothetical protein IKA11_04830 [Clostridia bacterium]|nr:hypothetical protein [Clostridia bacterium]
MDVNKLLNDEIVISTYCGPQPAFELDGISYPDRITEEQYRLLKNSGVNLVFGHEDLMSTENEHLAFRALDIAEKVGIAYMVRDKITLEYAGLGDKYKDFRKMSEEEKLDLDRRFIESLNKYKDKKAFAGIVFIDEPGSDMFDGISRGKKVFESVCPGKIFYVNLFPYYITSKQYQFGWENLDEPTDPLYAPYVRENIYRYERYYNLYKEKVNSEVISYDAYPYASLGAARNSVHRILWEQQQMFSKDARENGKKFWQFLQCGGRWCYDKNIRVTSMGEVQHQISLALAYGAKGLQLYTGCFPNCCIKSPIEHSGIIDRFGNITEQYPLFQYAFMQVKAIQKYLVNATLKGMMVSDKNYFGLLPDKSVIEKITAGETIFNGELPEYENIEIKEYKELKKVTASSQCLVSCFDNGGESVYLLVNNSPYVAADVCLTFDGDYEYEFVKGTIVDRAEGKDLNIYALPAGENVLIRIVDKK